jgi:hypothetical protein
VVLAVVGILVMLWFSPTHVHVDVVPPGQVAGLGDPLGLGSPLTPEAQAGAVPNPGSPPAGQWCRGTGCLGCMGERVLGRFPNWPCTASGPSRHCDPLPLCLPRAHIRARFLLLSPSLLPPAGGDTQDGAGAEADAGMHRRLFGIPPLSSGIAIDLQTGSVGRSAGSRQLMQAEDGAGGAADAGGGVAEAGTGADGGVLGGGEVGAQDDGTGAWVFFFCDCPIGGGGGQSLQAPLPGMVCSPLVEAPLCARG